MTHLNRRLFLTSAAALPAATIAAATIAAVPVSASPLIKPLEDPRLLDLGEQIQPLLDECLARGERQRAHLAEYERLRPPTPPQLIARKKRDWHISVIERNPDGSYRAPENERLRIICAEKLREAIRNDRAQCTPKELQRLRSLLKTARAFEKGIDCAWDHARIEPAKLGFSDAFYAIRDLHYDILKVEPRTYTGILIYAKAIEALDIAAGLEGSHYGTGGIFLGSPLATALLRHAAAAEGKPVVS